MAAAGRKGASAYLEGRGAVAASVLLAALLAVGGGLALVVTAPGLGGGHAAADPAHVGVGVGTDPTGVHVHLGRDFSWIETGPGRGPSHGSTSGTGGCHRRWVLAFPPLVPLGSDPASQVPEPYNVFCDDTYITTVWLTPAQFNGGNPTVALGDLAGRLARDIPFPPAAIGISPEARGLTGLETWYWVTGYDGRPLTASVSGFGTTVTVEARPVRVVWDFGDGHGSHAGGLGHAAPARSDVTHVYETRSGPSGFTVAVRFELATRYRVNGGPWRALDPVERNASRTYPVDESRSQLQPSDG